jgi:hypothetical protein
VEVTLEAKESLEAPGKDRGETRRYQVKHERKHLGRTSALINTPLQRGESMQQACQPLQRFRWIRNRSSG